jgi:uncharacterized protein (TIGR02145 family)
MVKKISVLKALNKKIKAAIIFILSLGFYGLQGQTELHIKDADGNIYKTVKIGKQIWMAENLKTTKYNDGTRIPLISNGTVWANFETIGYCWYENDSAKYINPYGALYNWRAINTGKLCPANWHVPTYLDLLTLTNYLGDTVTGGDKLKESGTAHWLGPNNKATNLTGFTALPGGARNFIGSFAGIREQGYWWSSTEVSEGFAWSLILYYTESLVLKSNLLVYKTMGQSVRCLKD